MSTKSVIVVLAALAMVTAVVPAASASHHVFPPDETGLGAGDVRDEPNHPDDSNGLGAASFQDTLIFEGLYAPGAHPAYFDIDNVVAEVKSDHQRQIYPGMGFLAAWWGWWTDSGSGGQLNEYGLGGSTPDGSIQDGHDDHSQDNEYTGPWDEFIWRGKNPWASQHLKASYPGDKMLAFVDPGSVDNCCSGQGNYVDGAPGVGFPGVAGAIAGGVGTSGALLNAADNPQAPDLGLEDRTDQGPTCPGVLYCNNIAYGWLSEFGWMHIQYDQSLLITTTITYSVNPKDAGSGLYHPLQGADGVDHMHDVDAYRAVNPTLESLYRQAVWDPGNEESGTLVAEEGAKQVAKDVYTSVVFDLENDYNDARDAATAPGARAEGIADDATGTRPRAHEPNTAEDNYNGFATFDAATSYGAGGLNDPYYQPGAGQTYAEYAQGEHAWMDSMAQYAYPGYGVVIRLFAGSNFFPAPHTGDLGDQGKQTAFSPGVLYIESVFGSWFDQTGDTFVGDLDERGRLTSSADPYRGGTVDDPNDYEDTARSHRIDPAKAERSTDPEWRGTCDDTMTAVIEPTSSTGWGTAGVYILKDDDSQNFNPYDEILEDTVGDDPTGVAGGLIDWGAGDGDMSRHVTGNTPVVFSFECLTTNDNGWHLSQENLILPLGTLETGVKITTTGTITETLTAQYGDTAGTDLKGESIVDVDFLRRV